MVIKMSKTEKKKKVTNKNNKKSVVKIKEDELKEKTMSRRGKIGLLLMLPAIIAAFTSSWINYLYPSIDKNLKNIVFIILINLFLFGLFILRLSRKEFVDKEFEDRKLKKTNYKFTFKELFYRYVEPDTVKHILTRVGAAVLLFLLVFFTVEEKELLAIIGYSVFFVFYTIWSLYCNVFSDTKGRLIYIARIIAALLYAYAIYIA